MTLLMSDEFGVVFCVFDLCAFVVLSCVMCVCLTYRSVRGVGRCFLTMAGVVHAAAHPEVCLIIGLSVSFRLIVLPWALGPPLRL
jgi:hypothetical protein